MYLKIKNGCSLILSQLFTNYINALGLRNKLQPNGQKMTEESDDKEFIQLLTDPKFQEVATDSSL